MRDSCGSPEVFEGSLRLVRIYSNKTPIYICSSGGLLILRAISITTAHIIYNVPIGTLNVIDIDDRNVKSSKHSLDDILGGDGVP